MSSLPATPELQVIELQPRAKNRSMLAGNEGYLWMLGSAVMLFIGILKGINLVIVLGYVLFGLWAINWLLARRGVRGLTARRPARTPLQAGMPAEWTVEIQDAGRSTGVYSLEERIGDASATWLVMRTGQSTVFRPRVRATFPKRGQYTLQPLLARSTFPFGLASKKVRLLPADDVTVLPDPAWIDPERLTTWLFRAWSGRDEERRRIRRVVEREAEVHGLRDYRAGDSPRRVHWKATARRNRLTVREYEDSAPPRLLLIVDPWIPHRPKPADRQQLEAAISLAAGIVREWRRGAGARLSLVLVGPNPVAVDGPSGTGITEKQLVALALEPGGESGDVAACLRTLSRQALSAPALAISSRALSPIVEQVRGVLGRSVAFCDVGRPEAWFRLPKRT